MPITVRSWRPWLLLVACTTLALAGSVVTQLPVSAQALPTGMRPLLVLVLLAAFLGALLRPGLAGWRRRCALYGLTAPRTGAGVLLLLIPGVLVTNYGALLLLTWLLEPEPVWVPVMEGILGQPGGLAVLTVLLLLTAPLIEELLLRGRLQRGLARDWGAPAAIAVPAVIFAWLHGTPSLVPVYAVFGALLGLAAWWSGSVWTAVLIHAGHNGATLGLFLAARAAGVKPGAADTAEAGAALVPAGMFALALGGTLSGLALYAGGWPARARPLRWRPLLWLAPVLLILVLVPAVWS